MTQLEQLQSDTVDKLESEGFFSTINVKSLRKMRIQEQLDFALVSLSPKGTKNGCGVVVGMPVVQVESPNVPAPMVFIELPIDVYENPTLNMEASSGTVLTAEEVGMEVISTLHQWGIEGLGTLYFHREAMAPLNETPGGVIGYRITGRMEIPREEKLRVVTPLIGDEDLVVTLTAVTEGSDTYYTTDGSFPGPGNAAAVLYTVPFEVESGTVVRWAGYKSGWVGSDVGRAVVTGSAAGNPLLGEGGEEMLDEGGESMTEV